MSLKNKKEVVKKSKREEAEEESEEELDEEEETTDDDTETDEEADDESDDEDGEDGGSSEDEEVDYKAIAEKEKQKTKDLEALIARNKFKKKHKEDEEQDEDEEEAEDDDKPLTRGEAKALMNSVAKSNQLSANAERIDDITKDIADSQPEADAIKAVHANRTWPSDVSLRQQLEESQAIVNRKKSKSVQSELKRALKGKDGRINNDPNAHRDTQRGTAPKLSKADERAMVSAGFTLNKKLNLYTKKLGNGKTLFKDPKKGKAWVGKL